MIINDVTKNPNDKFYDNLILGLSLIKSDFKELETPLKYVHLDELSQTLGDYRKYPNPNPINPGRSISAIVRILAETLAEDFGWKVVRLREDHEGSDDDILSVVDLDYRYIIPTIGACYASSASGKSVCRNLYEKIKKGNLPDASPGSFHEVELRN